MKNKKDSSITPLEALEKISKDQNSFSPKPKTKSATPSTTEKLVRTMAIIFVFLQSFAILILLLILFTPKKAMQLISNALNFRYKIKIQLIENNSSMLTK